MLRISEFILNFVLNSAWQVAAIFVIAAFASWLLKNAPARHLYTLWVVALTACLVVPLLTTTRFVQTWVSSFQLTSPTRQQQLSVPQLRDAEPIATSLNVDGELAVDHLITRVRQPISTTNQIA